MAKIFRLEARNPSWRSMAHETSPGFSPELNKKPLNMLKCACCHPFAYHRLHNLCMQFPLQNLKIIALCFHVHLKNTTDMLTKSTYLSLCTRTTLGLFNMVSVKWNVRPVPFPLLACLRIQDKFLWDRMHNCTSMKVSRLHITITESVRIYYILILFWITRKYTIIIPVLCYKVLGLKVHMLIFSSSCVSDKKPNFRIIIMLCACNAVYFSPRFIPIIILCMCISSVPLDGLWSYTYVFTVRYDLITP